MNDDATTKPSIETVLERIDLLGSNLQAQISGLQEDFGKLRTEVGSLTTEFGALKGEVGTLTGEFGSLRVSSGHSKRSLACNAWN